MCECSWIEQDCCEHHARCLLPIADAFRRFRESIADSDLEDEELQKMLISPLYAQKASGKPDAMVTQEREVVHNTLKPFERKV